MGAVLDTAARIASEEGGGTAIEDPPAEPPGEANAITTGRSEAGVPARTDGGLTGATGVALRPAVFLWDRIPSPP